MYLSFCCQTAILSPFYGSLSGHIPVLPLLMSGLGMSSFPPLHILHISGGPLQDWQWTCLSWLGWDQRLCNKTAQVWQKCTLSRSWSPLDGAKFGIKRSNGLSIIVYLPASNKWLDGSRFSLDNFKAAAAGSNLPTWIQADQSTCMVNKKFSLKIKNNLKAYLSAIRWIHSVMCLRANYWFNANLFLLAACR